VENNLLLERIKNVKNELDSAILKTGRKLDEVKLMAVSKNASINQMIDAKKAGLDLFGENYLNKSIEKLPVLFNDGFFDKQNFHMIGHLQTNKVKKALSLFSCIESVDSLRLATEIASQVTDLQNPFPIMLEVKTSVDESKFGFEESVLLEKLPELLLLRTIHINGLMTIASLGGSCNETRRCFSKLRNLKEKIEHIFKINIPILSMGMSEDFKIAIEEGSNLIRIGRAIFGG